MTVMLFKDYWSMLYKKILFQSFYFKISRLIHCELFSENCFKESPTSNCSCHHAVKPHLNLSLHDSQQMDEIFFGEVHQLCSPLLYLTRLLRLLQSPRNSLLLTALFFLPSFAFLLHQLLFASLFLSAVDFSERLQWSVLWPLHIAAPGPHLHLQVQTKMNIIHRYTRDNLLKISHS